MYPESILYPYHMVHKIWPYHVVWAISYDSLGHIKWLIRYGPYDIYHVDVICGIYIDMSFRERNEKGTIGTTEYIP